MSSAFNLVETKITLSLLVAGLHKRRVANRLPEEGFGRDPPTDGGGTPSTAERGDGRDGYGVHEASRTPI